MLSSRPVHWPTDGRMAAKTPGRENPMHRGVLMTVHGKGKQQSSSMAPLQPYSVQPTRTTKDAFPSKNPIATKLVTRPLGDRTPFPNRDAAFNTPLPGETKLAKLVLLDSARPNTHVTPFPSGTTPPSALRPSSARKHIRAPRTSSRFKFETPITKGNHWDVSELDLLVPPGDESQLLTTTLPGAETDEDDDDYSEVEYMPPKQELEAPPLEFALPDYGEVGRALVRGAQAYAYDDDAPPVDVEVILGEGENGWEMPVLELGVLLSDDPFLARPEPSSRPLPAPAPARKQPITSSSASARTSATAGPSDLCHRRPLAPTVEIHPFSRRVFLSIPLAPNYCDHYHQNRPPPRSAAAGITAARAASSRGTMAAGSASKSTPAPRMGGHMMAQRATAPNNVFRRLNGTTTTTGGSTRGTTTTATTARTTPAIGTRGTGATPATGTRGTPALARGRKPVGVRSDAPDVGLGFESLLVAGGGGGAAEGEAEEDFLFDV
ncbi:hypothetical protein C8F04DRAFT_1263309 [Mycena alexandri]|uniref:Uncharacterized protein n=1 Tax=Mycena alexandri TaxID=1745969 RepID=A0AAD6SR63_9AGAR|nr:hypothetical protein C8F04DRAFT_1263309 [Mycena alexandri]